MNTIGNGPSAPGPSGRYTSVASLTPSSIGTICFGSALYPNFAGEILGSFHFPTVVNASYPRRTITTSLPRS
jgi:hypothetical protein